MRATSSFGISHSRLGQLLLSDAYKLRRFARRRAERIVITAALSRVPLAFPQVRFLSHYGVRDEICESSTRHTQKFSRRPRPVFNDKPSIPLSISAMDEHLQKLIGGSK